jgi:hypothetical protein
MRGLPSGRHRLLGGGVALSLLAVACGSGQATSSGAAATSMGSGAMAMQSGAENMRTTITSPANGTVVTANTLDLQVATSGFDDTCALAGKEDQPGKGHYHVLIDKSLVNMFCTPQATVSFQNVKPGRHDITVMPAQDDHTEIDANANTITVDYEPTSPTPAITDATLSGSPSIKIVSPAAGSTVSGSFDVVVQVTNYNLSCDLLGKPDVAGFGHWHLNLDSDNGPMMGMGTMLGMACTTTFHASTEGLATGSTHTLIALLTDNGHAPLHPAVESRVDVTIG